ncbi:MAG: peptidoglycan-associated lipoprotein, partial [Gammaproteobacteria bacterium]|nr:peptidoglycan-associated lipoprotein [Gammaproteobacteria bacterium]
MKTTTRVLLAAALCFVVVGCARQVQEEAPPPPTTAPPTTTEPAPTTGVFGPEDLDTDACLRQRVVYFDFDQEALRPEFQAQMA